MSLICPYYTQCGVDRVVWEDEEGFICILMKISLLQLENHIGAAKSKRFILNTTTSNVSQQASPPGGTIGWVIAAGAALGVTTALDCAVEIIQTSNGATVYAEVTRSGTNVTINFSTPVSQGAYQAIVTRIN